MAIIADASVLIDILIDAPTAGVLRARLSSEVVHAPVTVDAEVLHGLRRHVLAELIDAEVARFAVLAVQAAPVTRHPVQPLVVRMWELRHNITAYDAAYVALAERLNVPLITRDGRLARSSGHSARIEYIA
ncbi:MAG TPA: type II toxin-antitoxin system VapC family toxin [Thermoanaerobaculia bacterium]|jgi:predicted nucleic acid-binding protein